MRLGPLKELVGSIDCRVMKKALNSDPFEALGDPRGGLVIDSQSHAWSNQLLWLAEDDDRGKSWASHKLRICSIASSF